MSLNDKVNAQEDKIDAGITGVQRFLEELKQSSHSAWVMLLFGVVMLVVGVWVWLT